MRALPDGDPSAGSLRIQIEEFNELIKAKRLEPQASEHYIQEAKKSRVGAITEIHVLFATQESITDYYCIAQPDWISHEKDYPKPERRRIIVVDTKIFLHDTKFTRCLAKIYEACTKSSAVKLISKDEAKKKFPEILRDFGIFWLTAEQKRGFFSYVPFPQTNVFGQYPGKYYIIGDQVFLDKMTSVFDKVWHHLATHTQSHKELELKLLNELEKTDVASH